MATLLIRDARHIWTGDAGGTELAGASILCEDGVIARVGTPDQTWPTAERTLDAHARRPGAAAGRRSTLP